MKRRQELYPISWEHHDALVVGMRIEKGLANGADPLIMRDYLLSFWANHLKDHFQAEESHIIPAIPEDKRIDPSILHVLDDHKQFHQLAEELAASSDDSVRILQTFAALLKSHVDHEEHKFLPFAEVNIPEDSFPQVARELNAYYVQADKGWDPEFWK